VWRGFVSSSKPLGRNFRVRAAQSCAASSFGAVAFVFHAVISWMTWPCTSVSLRSVPFQVGTQARVVKAEEMEDGGVEIVKDCHVIHGLPAEFIGRAVAETGLYAGFHQPAGEAFDVVVAAGAVCLHEGKAAKLGAPDDERLFDLTALLEVAQERGSGLIKDIGVGAVAVDDFGTAVPVELDRLFEHEPSVQQVQRLQRCGRFAAFGGNLAAVGQVKSLEHAIFRTAHFDDVDHTPPGLRFKVILWLPLIKAAFGFEYIHYRAAYREIERARKGEYGVVNRLSIKAAGRETPQQTRACVCGHCHRFGLAALVTMSLCRCFSEVTRGIGDSGAEVMMPQTVHRHASGER